MFPIKINFHCAEILTTVYLCFKKNGLETQIVEL